MRVSMMAGFLGLLAAGCGVESKSSDHRTEGASPAEEGDIAVAGDAMSFTLPLPAAEPGYALASAQVTDPLLPPVNSSRLGVECVGGAANSPSEFKITLIESINGKTSEESAAAFNCGKAVAVKIKGLVKDAKYQLAAMHVVGGVIYSGESISFDLNAGRIKLAMIKQPPTKGVVVDVIYEGAQPPKPEPRVCPMVVDAIPSSCSIAIGPKCADAPSIGCAAVPLVLTEIGQNKCLAFENLRMAVLARDLVFDESKVKCQPVIVKK